jgi:hypothetical protein
VALYGDDGDGAPHTLVQAQVVETLQWCMQLLVRQDEAGAALHLSQVHYSPLTFAVAESLHTLLEYQPASYWPPGTQQLVDVVLSHRGLYDSPPPPSMS